MYCTVLSSPVRGNRVIDSPQGAELGGLVRGNRPARSVWTAVRNGIVVLLSICTVQYIVPYQWSQALVWDWSWASGKVAGPAVV